MLMQTAMLKKMLIINSFKFHSVPDKVLESRCCAHFSFSSVVGIGIAIAEFITVGFYED